MTNSENQSFENQSFENQSFENQPFENQPFENQLFENQDSQIRYAYRKSVQIQSFCLQVRGTYQDTS
ncbi:hypothetical protein A9239_09180 [Methanosarcina sp. A14]|uniref:Uncharacterized protein n=1 Tax=Methanosarcina barkeri CM1 TaxID=796385 RepID=A0A0G3CH68_METBA|nr:hypothetical protein MCM1_2229 [Methanosarcina barkeri CM1]OED08480.1 hypothetical protein A9239_09180 [Methanosarcina sp. A14]